MSGKVAAIYLSDGKKVKKDDVVLRIEDHGRTEQVEKARALLKQRERVQVQVEEAFTALQSAKADLKGLELDLEILQLSLLLMAT